MKPIPMVKQFQKVVTQEKGTSFTQVTLETARRQNEILLKSLECFTKKQHRQLSRLVFPILSMYQSIKIHRLSTEEAISLPELTPVFCATDDWLSAAMPKISWKRTQTLGLGCELCDFCWCRKGSNAGALHF